MYAVNAATLVCLVFAEIFTAEFPADPDALVRGPQTQEERLKLMAAYAPFFICPVLMLFRMVFGEEFTPYFIERKKFH